ncbi:MAG: hypothetical protein N3A65_03100 [candidate division WOR-3 bacterium]|nr:hypothetical protein [candidate division WOR-3 bacterium]
MLLILMFCADFVVCSADSDQVDPCVIKANNQYYVFWWDKRYMGELETIYGARVSNNGVVIDPNGKMLHRDSSVGHSPREHSPRVVYDGTNFLVVFRHGC